MPKKNVYRVAAPKGTLPENRFFFTLDIDGKPTELSFPKFQWLDRKITRLVQAQGKKREQLKEEGKQYLLVDEVEEWIEIYSAIEPSRAEVFEGLSDDQIMDLSKAWLEATEADIPEEDIPESKASSDS